MARALFATIQDEILDLKARRKALILAHNYQMGEIQDVADYLGDSLGLALHAQSSGAEVILFCGVHFMAETVSILCPEKKVIIPDWDAGCSLASMITPEQIRLWKAKHPAGIVLSYVNCSAAVKAESDYCCTSANAEKVLSAIDEKYEILFVPDFFLGRYLEEKTGRKLHLWKGFCHAHMKIRSERIESLRREHPGAEFLMHPECGCLTKSMSYADKILSTEGIVKHVNESSAHEFIIATEIGIIDRLKRVQPEKKFYPAGEYAACEYMKLNTLEKMVAALERLQYAVKVPKEIADRARVPLERMLALS